MKTLLRFVAGVVMAALFAVPTQLFAQAADTLDIAALPPGNVNAVIVGDTLAGGVRAHPNRVYRLARGSVYQVTEPIKVNGTLKIVATAGTTRPPVLAPAILSDNSSIDHFFNLIGRGARVEISNLYLLSVRADNNTLGWSAGIRINADSVKLKLRGVIFDAFSEAGIRVYASWSKVDVQDCHFRNLQHSTSWFGGQPFMTDFLNHLDTCKFVNNTFFSTNSYLWSVRGFDRFSLFEHNTLAYITVNPFLTRQGYNLHIKNNLFYAVHAMGGNPDHVINGWFLNWPDTTSSSIINIRSAGTYQGRTVAGVLAHVDSAHGVTASMLNLANRTVEVRNNAYFWPKKLTDFYQAYNDTVQTADSVDVPSGGKQRLVRRLILPKWINGYTQYVIDSVLMKQSPSTTLITNNTNADPAFNTTVAAHIDKLIDYVKKISTNKLDVPWFFPNNTLYPPTWPLPENLTYTNSALLTAGTDGFPVGDLNWFPTQKGQWLLTDVEVANTGVVPVDFKLYDAFPNPFNPETNIKVDVARASDVKLTIFNILGQEMKTLVNERMTPGSYTKTWNGTDNFGNHVPSGVYFYRLDGGTFTATKKLLLLK